MINIQNGNDWFNKGDSLYKAKRYEEAIRCYDQALQFDLGNPSIWNNRGLCFSNLGRLGEAISCYGKALQINPKYLFAWCNLGINLDASGRHEEALQCFDRALELDPQNVIALDNKNLCESKLRRLRNIDNSDEGKANQHPASILNSQNTNNLYGKERQLLSGASYQPGDVIGQKYEVQKVLGEGGFGVVYLVYDRQAGAVFALKTFLDKWLNEPQVRDLFRKEAGIWVELESHPYLVRAYGVIEISGRLFIAMEYIAPNEQGINTMDGYLKKQPPDLSQSLRWAIQICHGMEYAYSKGVRAHRDIKPENIMIGQDGIARITDFGLATVISASLANPRNMLNTIKNDIPVYNLTHEGGGFGTITHMPPEQFYKDTICDERSDIYSFGVALFQMVSGGRVPFMAPLPRDESEGELLRFELEMQRQQNEAPIPQLDSPLFPILQCCLEKPPEKRYQTFKDIRKDLEPLLQHQTGESVVMPQLNELEAWELSNKGASLEALGLHEEAIRSIDKALKINPRNVLAWNNKGASLEALGRHDDAIRCYDQAQVLDPYNVLAWNNKGNSFENSGRHDDAIRCYDKALEFDSHYIPAWINKVNSLNSIGHYEEAIHCCDQALELDPHVPFAWSNKGNSLNHLKHYEDANHCYDKALELDPREATIWYNKGNNLENLGFHEKAICCLDKALEINPRYGDAWCNKGVRLNDLGHYEDAIRCYDQALRIDPRNAIVWNNKSNSLESLGRHEEAIRCLDKVLELAPSFVAVWFNKGLYLARLDRHEEAIRCFDQVLILDPSLATAWSLKSVSLNSLGRYEEGIRCLDKALELDPRNLGTLFDKALAQDQLRQSHNAAYTYREFLSIAPAEYGKQIEFARQRIHELENR